VWTALLWGGGRRWWLAALIGLVQVPVAIIGFAPIENPVVHLALFAVALGLTGASLWLSRTRPVAVRGADLQPHD